jgi:aspartate-semialdehyde dehydrogenase
MKLVGIVGWRGMVGSVLMHRMQQEDDFSLFEPLFFSTSNAGGTAPSQARNERTLQDAHDVAALRRCDVSPARGATTRRPSIQSSAPPAGEATGSTRRRPCG